MVGRPDRYGWTTPQDGGYGGRARLSTHPEVSATALECGRLWT
jgi:hypothetical protein